MCDHRLGHFLKLLIFLSFSGSGAVWAYLGGFEESDGYRVPSSGNILSLNFAGDAQFYLGNNPANGFTGIVAPGAYPNSLGDATHGLDVSRYNAGQYGSGGGGSGGSGIDIADNTGSWRALSGGRLNEDLGAPYYLGGPFQRDYIAGYNYGSARTGSQVLNLLAYDENLRYSYSLDSRDFDGINPVTASDMRIEASFWTCPTDADDDLAIGINTVALSFRDSMGQILVDVGYTGDNFLQYRVGGASTWQVTALNLGATGWSQISLVLDTHSNSVSLAARAYSDLTGTLGADTTVLTNELLGFNTDNVTEIQWTATDVDGFKNFFDDFDFTLMSVVPEPGSLLLVLLAGLVGMRRRRLAAGPTV
ncbi:MAG: PEP-CTERM sorting domain-containing protein [Verrucomicrobiota bacterium]